MRVIPKEYLLAGNPLPKDAVWIRKENYNSDEWEPVPECFHGSDPLDEMEASPFWFATALPLPCFTGEPTAEKGGEPCAPTTQRAPATASSPDRPIQGAQLTGASNAQVESPIPSTGATPLGPRLDGKAALERTLNKLDSTDGKTELMPCPFCGNENIQMQYGHGVHWASCWDCNSDGPQNEKKQFAIELWNERRSPITGNATGTEARVCADIAARQQVGIKKYGTTVEANPLPSLEWARHAYQESLDMPIYLKRLIEELEKPQPLPVAGNEWRPISEAPKDGTMIDLFIGGEFPGRRTDCFWGKPSHSCGEDGQYCDSEWHSSDPSWVDSAFQEHVYGEPTHFRFPLNPPMEDSK
jgi:Lar family restriction alleviation protein